MKYSLVFLRSAKKQLSELPEQDKVRVARGINKLRDDPRPSGAIKLTNRNAWRIRVGVYRVIYEIADSVLKVTVVEVGHRGDVYRKS